MRAHVDIEAILARVLLPTDAAHERFISRMNELVGFEMALCFELLSTAILPAHKRPIRRLKS